jgi:hypothetical protein
VVQGWPDFITAVEAKFGVHDYRQFMSELLALKQTTTVAEYCTKFQELVFKVSTHNPHYDDTFFVSQFLKGLKPEIRLPVASQIPETLDRAILLAHVQQDLQSQHKPWVNKHQAAPKQDQLGQRTEPVRAAVKVHPGDMWRERQLRDYRRANNLCFRCGDKFDPQHQCPKKAEVHMMIADEHNAQISKEVLDTSQTYL